MYMPLAFRASTVILGCRRSRSVLSLRVPERANAFAAGRCEGAYRETRATASREGPFGDETILERRSFGLFCFFRDRVRTRLERGDRRDAFASVTSRARTMRVRARASSVFFFHLVAVKIIR